MKTINVTFEDTEFEQLDQAKGLTQNWREFILTLASVVLYSVIVDSVVFFYFSYVESSYTLKVVDHCTDQKGVAVPTVRGDVVCIREDALTEVLGKSTNHVK
jgi:hypothetical protein